MKLLDSIVDYAGLFPPAGLPMSEAVRNYSRYRAGENAWMLGRFVVPCGRLPEFSREVNQSREWPVSMLAAPDLNATIDAIERYDIDIIEFKASTADQIERTIDRLPGGVTPYFEIPIAGDAAPLMDALAACGARAKVRTGGITPDAFPAAPDLAQFIRTCYAHGVPFKATAGLHHPIRGVYPLTYDKDSAKAPMFGFLNVFLAAAFAAQGAAEDELVSILNEECLPAFSFDDGGVGWRGRRLTSGQIAAARRDFAIAFGSCSFEEPVRELKAAGVL